MQPFFAYIMRVVQRPNVIKIVLEQPEALRVTRVKHLSNGWIELYCRPGKMSLFQKNDFPRTKQEWKNGEN